jgi:surface polysaccharide O-acyltransferase-like enzyme
MRWVHITSVIVLVGSAYYVRRTRSAFSPAFRTTIYWGVAAAVVSGLYNFLTKASYPPHYHMWFGIKVLLALHVMAALVLAAGRETPTPKLERSLRILLISATVVILISNYLRWISLSPVVQLP